MDELKQPEEGDVLKQASSNSMAPMLEATNQDSPMLTSTVIPIREEFRCRRSWFFYHDIRALVTSWIPVPIFLVWRVFVALYLLAWLIAHIAVRHPQYGPRWIIYLTNLAYLVLVTGFLAMLALNIWYTILHYAAPNKLTAYLPRVESSLRKVFRQDNIPWFAKLTWAVYIVGASVCPLVVAGYWILDFGPDCMRVNNTMTGTDDTISIPGVNTSIPIPGDVNTTMETPPTGAIFLCVSGFDVYSAHLHLVNLIIVFFDLFISRIPYQFMHFFYPLFFQVPYVIFTAIYWGAGGTNPIDDMRYIYSALDYSSRTAPGWAILLLIAPMPFYWLMFLLAWLRDVISQHVPCCYRDVTTQAYAVEEAENEKNGPESTAL